MKRLDSSLKTAVLALFHPNSEGFGRKNFFWSFLIFLLFFAFTMDFQDRQKAAVIISPQPEAGFGLDLARGGADLPHGQESTINCPQRPIGGIPAGVFIVGVGDN